MGRELQYRYVHANDEDQEADFRGYHCDVPFLSRRNRILLHSESLTHNEVIDRIANLIGIVKQKASPIRDFDVLEALWVFAYFAKDMPVSGKVEYTYD